jgi:hypothetical protein
MFYIRAADGKLSLQNCPFLIYQWHHEPTFLSCSMNGLPMLYMSVADGLA